jgi:hypothetical protein
MDESQLGFTREWVDGLLLAVEMNADAATRDRIFEACSAGCTQYWATKAREIRQVAGTGGDVESLIQQFGNILPGGDPDLRVRDGAIEWAFSGGPCPCPVSKLVAGPALCRCGTAHVRGMLEALLDRPLEVELVKSRRRGDEECLFVVSA